MDGRELLRAQFARVHGFVEAAIGDCAPQLLTHRFPGGTINPISVIYAHVLLAEDTIVSRALADGRTVFDEERWAERLGFSEAAISQAEDWRDREIALPAFREYALAVYRRTDERIAAATDEALSRNVGRNQPMTAVEFVAQVGVLHVAEHWGEIAALQGVLGAQGLKF